ncbi:MAG: ATP phosphoribosyltransferase regulatory subunit [bacterium]|jgi:ATP phosphoribosyltransferase regulatory subunit
MLTAMPAGPAYLLPAETGCRRELETALTGAFAAWGYTEIITPAVESLEVLQPGMSPKLLRQSCKFLDAQGRILLLRPDLTTPVAYLAATRLFRLPRPYRLSYCADVFRAEGQTGLRQAGVELMGAAGEMADTEVLSLAVAGLEAAGSPEYRIGVGHAGFIEGVLEEAGVAETTADKIRQALNRRDFVACREICRDLTAPPAVRELLLGLPTWQGGIDVLARVSALTRNRRAREALECLEVVYRGAAGSSRSANLYLDLSLVRDLDYYTGIVFEAYAHGLGRPILGGGRYDNLAEKFGTAMPAVGFAVAIDLLLTARQQSGDAAPAEKCGCLIVPASGRESEAMLLAAAMRQNGGRVETEITGRAPEAAREYARQRGIEKIIFLGGDGETIAEEISSGIPAADGAWAVSSLFGRDAAEWR